MQYIDIILFALLAAFVVIRLGRVLGRRPPDSGSPSGFFSARPRPKDNVVALPDRSQTPGTPVLAANDSGEPSDDEALAAAGVAEIRLQDPSFEPRQFLAGARAAYETVVGAFAAGDRETLRRLLTRDVLDNFSRAIDEREGRGETLETTVVGVDSAEVVDARMAGRLAEVTVRFVSHLVNVIRNSSGAVVSGDPGVKEVTDVWTFVRDVRSSDPNWALAETRSPA